MRRGLTETLSYGGGGGLGKSQITRNEIFIWDQSSEEAKGSEPLVKMREEMRKGREGGEIPNKWAFFPAGGREIEGL